MSLSNALRRLVVVAATLSVAAVATKDAVLAHWRLRPPERVPYFLTGDDQVRLRSAEAILAQPEQRAAQSSSIRIVARRVLKATPLSNMAIRQLGIVDAIDRPGQAKSLLLLAERVSRRDRMTQLLLIDHKSRAGDIGATLAHYDRVLSVSPVMGELLYPILAHALDDPDVRRSLVSLAPRPWLATFLAAAVAGDADPAQLVILLGELRDRLTRSEEQAVSTSLLARLVAGQDFAVARKLARQIPGSAPDAIDQIGFSNVTLDPHIQPLGWRLWNDRVIKTELESRTLVISVMPERTAIAADRTTLLAPGDYALTTRVSFDVTAPRALLEWRVSCMESGLALVAAALPVSRSAGVHAVDLSVPTGCAAQRWELHAYGDVAQVASRASLRSLSLVAR